MRATILARAGNCCEGSPQYPDCRAANGEPHPVTASTVVLTIAHLNHDEANSDPANLRAWCQRCHLTYNVDHHAATRRQRKALGDAGTPRNLAKTDFPYVFRWTGQGRKGQVCRVLVRGTRNSRLVEFEDGYRMVTLGGAIRWGAPEEHRTHARHRSQGREDYRKL